MTEGEFSPEHGARASEWTGELVVTERRTPLFPAHESAGAVFTDFGGWQMPVRYTSDLDEHHAVRRAAGLFDISHMSEFLVEGPDAGAFLDGVLAGLISTMRVGKAKYSLLLNERGGVVDDLIVYRTAESTFLIIANAGNRDAVAAAFAAAAEAGSGDRTVEDVSDTYALIAVQGPEAQKILETVDTLVPDAPLSELGYYASLGGTFGVPGAFDVAPVLIARTGYTGEDGFEILIPAIDALDLWYTVLEAGEPFGLVQAGLAARDTLRLEAGMPLHGHELSPEILPAQAGLGRVVALSKPDDFVGRAAVEAFDAASARVLVGLTAEGRRAARAGAEIYADGVEPGADGAGPIGIVTSGVLSPTLGHPIAMAFVDPEYSEAGTALGIDVRGRVLPATVTPLPFYTRKQA